MDFTRLRLRSCESLHVCGRRSRGRSCKADNIGQCTRWSRTWQVIFISSVLVSLFIGALTGLYSAYGITHHKKREIYAELQQKAPLQGLMFQM